MKSFTWIAALAIASLSLAALETEAKRLGSGGMKRSTPTQQAPQQTATPPQTSPTSQQNAVPAQQAAAPAAGTAAAAAAAPAKRSWMGPVAGLAAGLGLAALASHFGFGEALANVMTMVLIGIVLMLVIGFVMRRFAANKAPAQGLQFAGAGAPLSGSPRMPANNGSAAAAPPVAPLAAAVPARPAPQAAAAADDFDVAGFERVAKQVFIRMQAANDAGDQNDLRRFTTPQMYASIQQELLDRQPGQTQRTDVLELQAQVVERAAEQDQQIVSVRFTGLIREQAEDAAQPFDEIWHLQRPQDGSREWAIAGIQSTH